MTDTIMVKLVDLESGEVDGIFIIPPLDEDELTSFVNNLMTEREEKYNNDIPLVNLIQENLPEKWKFYDCLVSKQAIYY